MFLTTNTKDNLVIHLLPLHFFQSVRDSVSFLCRRCLFPLPLEWEREILSFYLSLSNEPYSTTLSLLSIHSVRLTTLPSLFLAVSFCSLSLLRFLFTRLSLICPRLFLIRIQCSLRGFNWAAVASRQQLDPLTKSAVGVVVMSNVVIVSWMSGMCNCFSLVGTVLELSYTTTLWLWCTQVICMNSKTFVRQRLM